MTVYVDNAKHQLGRLICSHMWADTEEELLAMCDTIGFSRLWVQRPGMKPAPNKPPVRWLHCDVSQMMRARAIEAGAVVSDRHGVLEHTSKLVLADPNASPEARGRAKARLDVIRQYREKAKA